MNKKIELPVRSYKTSGCDKLIPLYDLMQNELNKILSNPAYVNKIAKIKFTYINENGNELKKQPGTLWQELKAIIGNPLKGKVADSWYCRILYTNLIALMKSRNEQVQIYNVLKTNNFKINRTLRDTLASLNLYPTNSYLKILTKSKTMPTLAKKKTLILDFSVSAKQMFKVNEKEPTKYMIKLYSQKYAKKMGISQWVDFDVFIPVFIRENDISKISKVQFQRDKDGDFICTIPITFQSMKSTGKNILGVDLGKVKSYSATVLYEDGSISDEIINSKELDKLAKSKELINNHIDSVYKKIQRVNAYHIEDKKQVLRKLDYHNNRTKRTRLQKQMARLVAAEIVQIAIDNNCGTISLEKLNWLLAKGKKWNFSETQKYIEEVAQLFGIKVIKVNPKNSSKTNPITSEIGTVQKRDIVFKPNFRIDRDQLASLNLALRASKTIKLSMTKLVRRNTKRLRRRSRRSENKRVKYNLNLIKKESTEIVMFSHDKVTSIVTLMLLNKDMYTGQDTNVGFSQKRQLSFNCISN